jgi:hypothetical protein
LIGIQENGFSFADIYLRLKLIEKGVMAQRGDFLAESKLEGVMINLTSPRKTTSD